MADTGPDRPAGPGTPPTDAEPARHGPAESGSTGDTADEAKPGAADGSSSDGPGGTVPPWWAWVGRHRKPVALVAVLAVAAAVAVFVVSSASASDPEDVVRSYMDAIRSGDTQTALEIAGEPEDDGRLRFLSADALADDWSVERVVARHVRENGADVDVTIRAGDLSRQGRFQVVAGEDGWTIESPFVHVDLVVADLDVVELGGVRLPAERDGTREVPLVLFPGVYDLYPSLADRLAFDEPRFIAAPTGSAEQVHRITTAYSLTDAGAAAAQKAVDAAVDACARQKVTGPPGCPFDVSESPEVYRFDDVSDVAWTVVAHPVAHFARARNGGGVELVVRTPGTVRVTGTGVPAGAARTPFTLTCEFGLDNLVLDITPDGAVIGNDVGNDYSAPLTTECY